MKTASLADQLEYNDEKPAFQVLIDTDSSRETRIAMKKGQRVLEHFNPSPIVVAVFEGHITFGVNGEPHEMKKGDLIGLDGNVPHDLTAHEDSIVRLSVHKMATRKQKVAD